MRTEDVLVLAGLVLAVAVTGGAATVGSPHLEVSVPTAPVAVGDRVRVDVRAVGTSDLTWGGLEIEAPPEGPWAVAGPVEAVSADSPPAWRIELAPLAVGLLELPKMHVTVRGQDGEPHQATAAALPTVTVTTVLPPGEKVKPAALHEPVGVHGFPWEWVLPGALLLVPLIALGLWVLRRLRRRAVSGGPVPELPPLAELEALVGVLVAAVGREPAETVCDRLAGGVRRYLGRISGEPAQDMTSFELRLLGRRRGWPDEVQRGVQAVMNVADWIRFGRRRLGEEELRAGVERVLVAARLLEDHLAPRAADTEEAVP